MIDRAVARAKTGVGADRFGDKGFGGGNGVWEGPTEGEERGNGGGIGTASAVCVGGVVPNTGKFVELAVGIKDIEGGVFEVTALDQNGAGAEIGDMAGGLAHFGGRGDGEAGERRGFVKVGCDQVRFGQQEVGEGFAGGRVYERRAVFADHNRIDNEWAEESEACDGFDGGGVTERAGLDGVWRNVFEHGLYLFKNKVCRENFYA